MLLMETAGHDLIKCELKLGLVIWKNGSPTPDTLEGCGHRNYKLVHADDAERALLAEHGVKIDELVLKNHELHQRVPSAAMKKRWAEFRKERQIHREVEREVRSRKQKTEPVELRSANGAMVNGHGTALDGAA